MNLTEKQLSSKRIYDGKVIKLRVDNVSLPDGGTGVREYVRHCGGAAVLFIKDGKVALVKQYRYVYGKEIYEIPAGKIEEGEAPSSAAAREMEEETGYRAKSLVRLAEIYPSPGYTDEVIHVFLATEAEFVGERRDEGEFLTCSFMPIEEVTAAIERGEICDAKTVCAVYKYLSMKKS